MRLKITKSKNAASLYVIKDVIRNGKRTTKIVEKLGTLEELKKKLKNENTSYSQIVTECRMRYAVQMLLMDNKNITQVAQLCGYSSTSYFISVFKAFYGLTPLNYLAKQRQKVMW